MSDKQYTQLRVSKDILSDIFPNKEITETAVEFRINKSGSIVINKETSQYFNFATGEGGSLISLYAKENNISNSEAYKLLAGITSATVPHRRQEYHQPEVIKKDLVKYSNKLYEEATNIQGTLAEQYLVNRCLNPMFFPPTFKYGTSHKDKMLIAPLQDKNFKFSGIHRILLDDNANKITKKSLGNVKGNCIWLTSRDLLKTKVFISEGIEDGLSVVQENYGISCVATTGATFLPSLELPEQVTDVVILMDNDEASKKAKMQFYENNKNRFLEISFMNPPPRYKDFNEQLQDEKGSFMGVAYDH